jgi:hypothetical protein
VKKPNDVFGPYATVTLTDEHGDTKDQPFHEIVPGGFSIPSLDVLERKEVLPLLAQRVAQPPLTSKKLLAMYYHENLPISGIAACLQSACMPDLRDPETNCRFARERPIENYQPKISPKKQRQQY